MDREDWFKTALIAAVVLIDIVGMAWLGLRFDWSSVVKVAVTWTGLIGLGWFYSNYRIDPPVSHLMRETAHLVAFTAAGAVLSYLAAASGRPLIDAGLVQLDRLMGFDWPSYIKFVNERPSLGNISSIVYISTLPQVALAAILLPMLGRTDRSREFVMAVMIAALIAILISAILPSAGALAYYRPGLDFVAPNAPIVDLAYKEEFFRMRALEIPVLSLDTAKGLIAFPSYHVALSVLIALAFRSNWVFFVPLGLLNLSVILATPVDGGHHMSDAVSGAFLAMFALCLAIRVRAALCLSASPRASGQPVGANSSVRSKFTAALPP